MHFAVMQDRLWNAEMVDDMVKKLRSNNRGSETPVHPTKRTRDKACQLRKFFDSHKQTSVSMTNGQRTNKIHGPLFKFNLWDRKRLQQA